MCEELAVCHAVQRLKLLQYDMKCEHAGRSFSSFFMQCRPLLSLCVRARGSGAQCALTLTTNRRCIQLSICNHLSQSFHSFWRGASALTTAASGESNVAGVQQETLYVWLVASSFYFCVGRSSYSGRTRLREACTVIAAGLIVFLSPYPPC
ncbi:MAG: hypothetical protein EOO41_00825 [Methanobacteriota archaeon]|nr:MAG: hypothetical protein EOO41_00825 [Euryarchaeota archaeon]